MGLKMKEMTAMQAAYWLGRQHDCLLDGVAAHLYAEFDGQALNRQALTQAVRALYAKHPMLRLAITKDGQQRILPLSTFHQLKMDDLSQWKPDEVESFVHTKRQRMTHQMLDLTQGNPLEISLTLLPEGKHRLHIDADMIACDAQSFRLLVGDLTSLYLEAIEHRLEIIESDVVTFFQYLDAQQADRALAKRKEMDKKWWQERLATIPAEPSLPYQPVPTDAVSANSQRFAHWFTPVERKGLAEVARQHHLTLTQLTLALFSQVIANACQERQFRLNVPTFHRGNRSLDIGHTIGDFSNLLIFSADVGTTQTLLSLCQQTANQLHQLLRHESYSGVSVMRDLSRQQGGVQRSPIVFTSGMEMRDEEIFSDNVTQHLGRMNWVISQGAQVTLDAQIAPAYEGILLNWDVRMENFADKDITALFAHYVDLIRCVALHPEMMQQSVQQIDAQLGYARRESIQEMPLTPLQQAYLLGRSTQIALGGVAMHEFREYRGHIDTQSLHSRMLYLVENIPALRTRIDQEKWIQWVSPCIALNWQAIDLQHLSREQALLAVEPVRQQYQQRMHDLTRSPWQICVVQLPTEEQEEFSSIVLTSFDALIVDGRTHALILAALLGSEEPDIAQMVQNARNTQSISPQWASKKAQDEAYWKSKLHPDCPPPALPWKQTLETITTSRYARESLQIPKESVGKLNRCGIENGLFLNSLLTATILDVLSYWTTEIGMRVGFPVLIPSSNAIDGNESSFVILEHEKSTQSLLSQASKLQREMLEALEHLAFSGVDLNRLLMNQAPQALVLPVVLTNGLSWKTLNQDDSVTLFDGLTQTPQVALDIRLTYDELKNLIISFDYALAALETELIREMLSALHHRLNQITSSASLVAPLEPCIDLSHYRFNSDESASHDSDFLAKLAQQLFARTEDKTAVICGEQTLSYAQLGEQVQRVMWQLKARGLTTGNVLAICLPRSVEHIVISLASALSGIIWVPIDAASPKERLDYLLENCHADLVVMDKPCEFGNVIAFDALIEPVLFADGVPDVTPLDQLSRLSQSQQTAYYLYTSGTTGKPKCVVVNNQATSNVIGQTGQAWHLTSEDVVMSVTPLHHDMSVFDLFATLSFGATLVLPAGHEEKDALQWNRLIERHQVTIWVSVPAILEMLLSCTQAGQLHSLRLIAQGGDYIKPATITQLRAGSNPPRLISLGGPTETTIWSIWHELTADDVSVIPYGRPLAGNRYFIMDEIQRHVPQGVVGRIFTSGVNLAQGYLEDGELKQTDFVAVLDEHGHPVRAFRTGDQGYYRADGNIIFASRINGYVKVRGVRVSLPDIEKQLQTHPALASVVVVDYTDVNGDTALAALFSVKPQQSASSQALREFAKQSLPSSHIPSRFIALEALPLSANGKVDRKQCQAHVQRQSISVEPIRQPNQSQPLSPPTLSSASLSEFEQRVWREHQRHGDGRNQYATAYRMSGKVNIARLITALSQLPNHFPVLNRRYVLDEASGLTLYSAKPTPLEIHFEHVESMDEAFEHLVRWQNQPMDLAKQAALSFCLLSLGSEERVLGVISHQIISEQWDWRRVFECVTHGYNQIACDIDPVMEGEDLSLGFTPVMPQTPLSQALLPWLQPASHATWIEQSLPSANSAINTLCSRKYRIALHSSVLAEHGLAQPDKQEVLALIAALFARYLAASMKLGQFELYVPHDVERKTRELNGSMIESQLVHIALKGFERPLSQLSQEILDSMRQPLMRGGVASETHASAAALVTWLVDPSVHLQLEGLRCEKMLFAAMHPKFEVALGVGLNCQGALVLELALDASVSPHVGAYLLEQFVAAIGGRTIPSSTTSASHVSATELTSNNPPKSNDAHAALAESELELSAVNSSAVEECILAEFRSALGVAEMTAEDDFFDFGGHSLIATRVIGRLLSEQGIELHINDMFSFPNAKQLAQQAVLHRKPTSTSSAVSEVVESSKAPLSLAQASLWKAMSKYAKFGLTHIFNLPFALKFLDEVDEQAFGEAFHWLLLRHAGLRTHFGLEDGQPYQQVIEASHIEDYQWFWTSKDNAAQSVARLLAQEAEHTFDLSQELPLRLNFVRDEQTGTQYLSLLFHHIVLDEWSINILMDELAQAYQHSVQGTRPQWQTEPLPFHEFARKQRSSAFNQAHLNYWLTKFADVPWAQPLFAADHPLSNRTGVDLGEGGWVEIKLPKSTMISLYQLAKARHASLFNVMYAAISASVHCLGAPEKLLVGTPASGRLDAEFFDTVGYFTTMGVQLVDFTKVQTVWQLIEQVKNSINQSMPYTDIPIDLIEEGLKGVEHETEGHMFEVFIQLHAKNKLHGELPLTEGHAIRFQQVDPDKSESGLGLQFEILEERIEQEQTLRVMMSYMSKHYSPAQVSLLTKVTSGMFERFADCIAQDIALPTLKKQVRQLEDEACRSPSMG
ncbi:amino acid adenylation domain-containing protein [Vibrio cholerae]|nr:amino acid adenylation domain-containing protein [Vibrio cholerae]